MCEIRTGDLHGSLAGSEQGMFGMQKWQKFVISDDDDDDDDEDYQPIAAQKPAAALRPSSAAIQVSPLFPISHYRYISWLAA